ncbi:MAG: hypothetical protein K2X07_05030 [Caulobacteraceae bacterium]|nr:hypothetical protein [Caulobacteraceae bacterium]
MTKDDMAMDVDPVARAEARRSQVLGVVPSARVTSTYRSPERNRRAGGVPNSRHVEGNGVDFVFDGMGAQDLPRLREQFRAQGAEDVVWEGDHFHVEWPSGSDPVTASTPMQDPTGRDYRVVRTQALAPEDTPESLRAQGYELDPVRNVWFRNVQNDIPPAPMDEAYQRRAEAREDQVLDQRQADLENRVVAAGIPGDVAGAVAKDVGKGVFLEGGQAVLSGIKRGVNESLDLVDEVADWIERVVPSTIQWEGFDFDPDTPMRVRLTTQNDAEARIREAQGGKLSFWQRFGMGQTRIPTSEAERPETVTGRVIEGIGQFATGWVGGGQALRGWKAATRGQQIGKALAQGALADFTAFDGQEARLSNILEQHAPEAVAPVFSYLAAREDDPELLGRVKNAVEGAGLGVATDLIINGVRALKAGRMARDEARAAAQAEGLQTDPTLAAEEVARQGEELQAAVRESLGNPEGPRLRVKPAGVTPAEARGPGENVFDINLARIETPEDVRAVITGMADKFRQDVDLARRATRSWDQTREASGRVDWVQAMAARRTGQAQNAEEVLAFRQALNASATRVLDLARKVEAPGATLADQYAFRRATSVHAAIQNEFMGARAEAGRALNAFKIPAETPAQYLRQVDDLIRDAGANGTARDLARRVLKAAEKGDAPLNELLRQGWSARTREMVKLVYTNGLLSGVGTPVINVAGNAMMLGLNLTARAISPRLAGAFGGRASTQIGEASAMAHGYAQAMRDMFRLNPMEAMQRTADNGGLVRDGLFRGMAPGIDDAAPRGLNMRAEREEAGMRVSRPLGAAAWNVAEDSPLGRALDLMQMLVEAPSNFNQLTDDFFKVVAARGEMHSRAFRAVTAEGLEGEAARARYADLIQNPSDEILEAAEREMHDLTFTRETPGIAAMFGDLRRQLDSVGPYPFGTVMMPFLRTPANLVSTGLRYSPLAKFSSRYRAEIREGGATAEIAKAKVALGSVLWSVWMGMAMDGDLTGRGPSNRAQREAMMRTDEESGAQFQPYSVRIGERWWSFERLDPLGQMAGLIADVADLFKAGDWDTDRNVEVEEIVAHGVQAIGNAFFDKTSLRSVIEATSALLGGRTDLAERFLMSRASAHVPYSSALRMTRRGEDPYLRETWNVVSALRNGIPGLSDDLPVQRDLWGRPRSYETGLGTIYDAIGLVQTKRTGGAAIDMEILDNGVTVSMPQRSIQFDGERISLRNRPDIYSDFVREAGQPAFEHLEAVVTGNHPDSEFYITLPPGPGIKTDGTWDRGDYIRDVVDSYRRDARLIIAERYREDLAAMAVERQRRREAVRGF